MSKHTAPRPPVMEDVARLAGVSHQTVSRVLNMHPNVSAQTRQRVELAIAELGYRRNTAARSLVTRRSQTIGVLGAGMAHYGPANTLLGIQQAARDEGYSVSMASLSQVTPAGIHDALERFLLQSVDGIVVIVPHEAMATALRTIDVSVPLVAVGIGADDRLTVAAVDQRAGAVLAVQHLLDLGHTSIAHVSGTLDWLDAAARAEGWRHTLEGAGLQDAVLIRGDWSAESGYRAGLELAATGHVTALFAANDQMALGALRAFSELGLRVPEDISVVGFDDQAEAGYFVPPLTTVNQGFTELGTRCIRMLLSDMAHGRSGAASVLNPQLMVRDSTAPPRR
ncbi:LacI family DNA-binding transcriptional regulator [Arthrobacter sp. CJ23]|uniref:LacI family DNA-binding transcriptional regulator n=1 Tax=Arthrobacter sp. CJ23 TaxID=2972479 RepID=UPI00215BF449|nr:LacI family DNA-binding transcriptional regulator [Arthrobacter sp. CJ23]UVJ39798.1 LacI family DNA-binding transcriptional regulator [Arthrobacter sp. CJ23]